MKKLLTTIFCFSIIILYAQQIKIRYIYVKSPIVTLYENLYIKNKNVLSVQDSLFSNERSTNNLNPNAPINIKSPKIYFISDINNDIKRDFYYLDNIDSDVFFVYDKDIPRPEWKIDKNDTKKILGYNCYKAEATFRGSKIIAYYTTSLPYSTGPYKFYGLPGVILYVQVQDKSYDIWKADKIEIDNKDKIEFKPILNKYQKLDMRKFVKLKDEHQIKFNKKIEKDAPFGSVVSKSTSVMRFRVEQKYEWE